MKPVNCDFCGVEPSEATVSRREGRVVRSRLRLCRRCTDLHQYVAARQGGPQATCLHCGGPPELEAECRGPDKRFLGRFAVCRRCAGSGLDNAKALRISNLWTPGVLDLPPATERLHPKPVDPGPAFGLN